MLTMKVSRNLIIKIWSFFLALSIVIRCLPTLVYPNRLFEYFIIFGLSILSTLLFLRSLSRMKVNLYDLFWLLIPLFFFTGHGNEKYIFFTCISLMFYIIIQKKYKLITLIQYPLIIFAIITSAVTWISYFLPTFYINHILTLFPEGNSLAYSFLNKNMYHGFTNHYSRNSFYIIVGILLVFSNIISKQKHKGINISLLIFLFCTEFLVAKRGPTLFLLITLLIVLFVKEINISKKIIKSSKYICIAIVLFIFAYVFIPGVDNMIIRIMTPNNSDDISSGRFYLYGIAIKMFLNNPIFGQGWGSFLNQVVGTTYQGVHNDYLQLLAELGIVGFLVFIIANIGTLYCSYKVLKKYRAVEYRGTWEQKWILFSLSYQIFFVLYALTGLPHYSYEQFTLYIMLCGLGMGMYKYINIGGKM